MSKLTPKQKRFCEEYVIDLNGTQAAIRAGYSENSANVISSENLAKPNIKEYITELQKEISERNKITVDECVSLLAKMARFDIAELYDNTGAIKSIHDIPEDTRLAIEAIDTEDMRMEGMTMGSVNKVKLSSRRANIIELMKHLGGYEKDNDQKATTVNIPVIQWAKPQ